MKRFCAALVVFVVGCLFLVVNVYAQSSRESIEGGYLSYFDGIFDRGSLNADLSDVMLSFNDQPPASIDRLLVSSHVDGETGKQVIEEFSIAGFRFELGGSITTLEKLVMGNVLNDSLIGWQNLSDLFNLDSNFIPESLKLENFVSFDDRGDRFEIELAEFEATGGVFDFVEYEAQGRIKNLKWTFALEEPEGGEFSESYFIGKSLRDMGIDYLLVNLAVDAFGKLEGDRYLTKDYLFLEIENVLDIEIESSFDLDPAAAEKLGQVLDLSEDDPEFALLMGLLMHTEIKADIALTVTDRGTLDEFFKAEVESSGLSRRDTVRGMMQALTVVAVLLPEHYGAFAAEIQSWLLNGGDLRFSLSPDRPVLLGEIIAESGINLDRVIDLLGFSVKWNG